MFVCLIMLVCYSLFRNDNCLPSDLGREFFFFLFVIVKAKKKISSGLGNKADDADSLSLTFTFSCMNMIAAFGTALVTNYFSVTKEGFLF